MIKVLQLGRFLAAISVVLRHAVVATTVFVAQPPTWIFWIFSYGYLGVDFFFALSGFIIHYTMTTKQRGFLDFLYARGTRIMIPYWPIGVGLALTYLLLPDLSASGREWGWLPTLTLIPSDHPPALGVAWTLQHELLFYLFYAVLFSTARVGVGLTLWVSAIATFSLMPALEWPMLDVFLNPVNIEFVAGVLGAHLFLTKRTVPGIVAFGLAFGCLLGFVILGGDKPDRWLVGLACAAILPWLCQLERDEDLNVPGWLVFGGAASYSIYLIHNPLISIMARVFRGFEAGWLSAFVVMAVVGVGAGIGYYLLWERPMLRRLKLGHVNETSIGSVK